MKTGSPRHRRRFEHPQDGRFLTFSTRHRLALFNNDRIKDAFIDEIAENKRALQFRLFGYVIMPEHVHLLLIPNPAVGSVSVILQRIKGRFARTVIRRWQDHAAPILTPLTNPGGRIQFWQPGGGYDRNLISVSSFLEKIQYMHQNPVRRGLVAKDTDWVWSSSRWYAGDRSETRVPMDPIPG